MIGKIYIVNRLNSCPALYLTRANYLIFTVLISHPQMGRIMPASIGPFTFTLRLETREELRASAPSSHSWTCCSASQVLCLRITMDHCPHHDPTLSFSTSQNTYLPSSNPHALPSLFIQNIGQGLFLVILPRAWHVLNCPQ